MRITTAALFGVAVLVAAYTGFRMPGTWTSTLDAVSATDGFHRRFLVGTVLHPLAVATGYNYWIFTAQAFAVLAALLAVLTVAFLRAEQDSRRLVIIGWLLLPTGGFLFHDVGYFEQLLYLMLFAAIWLLGRDRPVPATGLMTLGVLAHEIALLTVLPIFAMLVLRRFPVRRAVLLLAPPVLVELMVLAVPPAAPGAPARLAATLAGANFPVRVDALDLFQRTQRESWQLYSVTGVLAYVVPIAAVVIGGFLLLHGRGSGAAVLQAAAIGAPVLLAFAGWDYSRWGFLVVANFAVILWLQLGSARRELSPPQVLTLSMTLLILTHIPMPYYDYLAPRELTWRGGMALARQIADQSLFRIPSA